MLSTAASKGMYKKKSLHQTKKLTSYTFHHHHSQLIQGSQANLNESSISPSPSTSMSSTRSSFSCLIKNKNSLFCNVNDSNSDNLLLNKYQTNIDTDQMMSTSSFSTFSHLNVSSHHSLRNHRFSPY